MTEVTETGATASFDALTASLDYPMVVVTTACRDLRAGCLVGFHSQCGIAPPRYAVWLSKANHTFRIGALAEVFAVHFLRDGDRALAGLFGTETGDDIDKFARCRWTKGLQGVPLLDDCLDRFVGRRVALLDPGADHVCVILAPESAAYAMLPTGANPGIGWLMSHDVPDLEAAHDSGERQRPR